MVTKSEVTTMTTARPYDGRRAPRSPIRSETYDPTTSPVTMSPSNDQIESSPCRGACHGNQVSNTAWAATAKPRRRAARSPARRGSRIRRRMETPRIRGSAGSGAQRVSQVVAPPHKPIVGVLVMRRTAAPEVPAGRAEAHAGACIQREIRGSPLIPTAIDYHSLYRLGMLLPIKDVMPARKSISRTQDGCADNALMNRRITVAAILLALTGSLVVTAPSVRAASPIVGTGRVYAGMSSSQWEATADLEAMAAWAGKKATFAGTFHDVFESAGSNWAGNTAWLLEQAWQAEATPVANLGINASAAAIAGGSYDNAIIAWANRVKAWTETPGGPQRTLFIAPLQEHNGDWTSYGCDPTNFRLAYARIRSLVQGVGLDETQVRWVWAPNGWTSDVVACKGKTLSDYYPGSEIVDVIGYSAYRWGEENVYTAVAGVADALRAIDSTKPYLVLQTAAWNTGSGSKEQWIRDLFSWATDDQNVVGIVWFNLAKETDWRVWNSTTQAGLSTGWRDALSSSSTIHTWPLTDWFQPGPLVIDALPGPCPDGSVCDPVAFVNSAGRWYRHDGLGSGDPVTAFYFGNPGDVPFMGDWDCDGVRTPGLYRQSDGFVYLRNTNTQGVADITFFFCNPRH